jgi:hypothetical protein
VKSREEREVFEFGRSLAPPLTLSSFSLALILFEGFESKLIPVDKELHGYSELRSGLEMSVLVQRGTGMGAAEKVRGTDSIEGDRMLSEELKTSVRGADDVR